MSWFDLCFHLDMQFFAFLRITRQKRMSIKKHSVNDRQTGRSGMCLNVLEMILYYIKMVLYYKKDINLPIGSGFDSKFW